MEIDVTEKGGKSFYREFLSVSGQYRKIRNNPNRKIINTELFTIVFCILAILLLVPSIIAYIAERDTYSTFSIICFGIIIFIMIFTIIVYENAIKKMMQNNDRTKVVVDENGVKIVKKESEIQLNYSGIYCIIVKKYGLYLIPTLDTAVVMGISNKYKDEVLSEVLKHFPNVLIVDKNK